MSARTRVRVSITGVVQGVGFRPTVARIAAAHRVGGFVLNDAGSVQCEFEGPPARVHAAVHTLRTAPPPLAHIDTFVVAPGTALGDRVFRILDSTPGGGDGRTLVAPDIATCPDCLRELFDPTDRRHGHPFITCTNCGPRYTVITDLPYDRPATTMAPFGMCAACAAEYSDPADRRFHAQTIACPDCGPRLAWRGPDDGGSPLDAAAAALQDGLIVAVKGIGGYHLACRADDDEAVARLRQRKNRPAKPFAVMVADIEHARRICVVDDAAERSLTSPAAPIVLLASRPGAVSDAVAPHLRDLGVMLAYSPIHHLLFAGLDVPALVMTSANQGGSPIVYRTEDLGWIDGLADAVLDHDRPIHVPCDDSVVRVVDGRELPIRRSRGFAPLPVDLGRDRMERESVPAPARARPGSATAAGAAERLRDPPDPGLRCGDGSGPRRGVGRSQTRRRILRPARGKPGGYLRDRRRGNRSRPMAGRRRSSAVRDVRQHADPRPGGSDRPLADSRPCPGGALPHRHGRSDRSRSRRPGRVLRRGCRPRVGPAAMRGRSPSRRRRHHRGESAGRPPHPGLRGYRRSAVLG